MQPSDVIGEAWAIYKAHWRHLIAVAIVVYIAISAIVLALAFVIGVFAAFVSLAGVFWLQGALVKAVDDVRDGRADLSVRETLESVLPRINVLTATGFLASIAVGLGLVLLIVPGLILLTIWSVAIPAVMLEGLGVLRSFGRSQELVPGHGWSVFAVIVLTVLLVIVAGLVVGLILQPVDPEWRLYARSAGDDKAPIAAILPALRAFRENRIAPTSNLIFFFDGEEEAGSPHLEQYLRQYRDRLGRIDIWLFFDGPAHQSGRPQITFGVRGSMSVEVTVYGATRSLHSGHYGNWATDTPALRASLEKFGVTVDDLARMAPLADPADVAREGLTHLGDGPTWQVGVPDGGGPSLLAGLPRRQAVELVTQGHDTLFGH